MSVPLVTPVKGTGTAKFAPALLDKCSVETLAPVSTKSIVPVSVTTPAGNCSALGGLYRRFEEVRVVMTVRIAGVDSDGIRALVARLHAQRATRYAGLEREVLSNGGLL